MSKNATKVKLLRKKAEASSRSLNKSKLPAEYFASHLGVCSLSPKSVENTQAYAMFSSPVWIQIGTTKKMLKTYSAMWRRFKKVMRFKPLYLKDRISNF